MKLALGCDSSLSSFYPKSDLTLSIMSSTQQSFKPTHIQERKPQIPGTGVPQKWQADQGALQINFLANTLCEQMAKHNDILQSYYNSLLYEEKQSHYLKSVIRHLQSKVQDAEMRRTTTEARMQILQEDYERLAILYNQNLRVVCTHMFDHRTNL